MQLSSKRRRRLARTALMTGAVISAAHLAAGAEPMISVSGSLGPSPGYPANVAYGQVYNISVEGVPDSTDYMTMIQEYSQRGDINGPAYTGYAPDWSEHGVSQAPQTCGAAWSHSFNDANYGSGYYWWCGRGFQYLCDQYVDDPPSPLPSQSAWSWDLYTGPCVEPYYSGAYRAN